MLHPSYSELMAVVNSEVEDMSINFRMMSL